jgi:hypothetical protein
VNGHGGHHFIDPAVDPRGVERPRRPFHFEFVCTTLFEIQMYTLWFVEGPPFECGFNLTRENWRRAPVGKVRVARFLTSFIPTMGFGYYGDFHLRELARHWKRKKRRRLEKRQLIYFRLPVDLIWYISEFL